jgi:hypothetical protein
MFDGIPVPDRQREVVPAGFRVPDEESSMFILGHQQLLLGLDAFDLAEVPPEKANQSNVIQT